MIRIEVMPEMDGSKISDCIGGHLSGAPRIGARLIKEGGVRLNGVRIKKDDTTSLGDVIEVYIPSGLLPQLPLQIEYEDENILVANKQPGVAVSPSGRACPDMLSAVAAHMQETGEYAEELGRIPFPCQKLDLYSGGLVIYAKNGDFFEAIKAALPQRRIKRIFQAMVKGCPQYDQGELQHFCLKTGDGGYKVTTKRLTGAMPIYTKYDVLASSGKYSLLQVEPVTNYVSQERAHLRAAGYPILGDPTYGDARLNRKLGIRHQAVWSTKIEFHTGTNNMLEYLSGKAIETQDIGFPLIHLEKEE